ncbi:MAG: hypothetical protein M1840_005210 [Geoglossum simile]|nr:MAG: hypothetical protein M1840_005210 [Geoglossum simile]
MAVPFGFSVGDFLTAGDLVRRVVIALRESRGAAADYRDLIKSLSSLQSSLQTASSVFLGLAFQQGTNIGQPDAATINGIMHELGCCRQLLEDFLVRENKFTQCLLDPAKSKGKRKVAEGWRKITWTIFHNDDILKLDRDLRSHIEAFYLYGMAIQRQVVRTESYVVVERSHTGKVLPSTTFQYRVNYVNKIDQVAATVARTDIQVNGLANLAAGLPLLSEAASRIDLRIAELADVVNASFPDLGNITTELANLMKIVTLNMPQSLGNPWESCSEKPIQFQDCIGRSVTMPLLLCATKESFQAIVVIMFRGLPGQKKVELLEYKLHGEGDCSEIGEDEWESVVTPGATVAISVLLHTPANIGDRACPKCQTPNRGPSGPSRMRIVQCRHCQLTYELIDRERIVELEDDRETDQESSPEAKVKSPSVVEEVHTKKPERTNTKNEEDTFRRISYIRETLVSATGQQSPVLHLRSLNGAFSQKRISVPFFPDVLRIGPHTDGGSLPTLSKGNFNSKVLSRYHAYIWAERGSIWIRDVNYFNSTFVNGQRLSDENKYSEPHKLQTGDILELGTAIVSKDGKHIIR